MISDKAEVSDFLALLHSAGIREVVLSPGSRNAPFSISLWENSNFNVHVVVDERSAGFIALGMAQQLQRPAVLICTSGTAILNYGPAVAEAFYQRVPLIVASADRPAKWIDQGEGQTIRQSGVFKNFTRFNADINYHNNGGADHGRTQLAKAIRLSMSPPEGPVHLNFPFDEPLYGLTESPTSDIVLGNGISAPESEFKLPDELLQALGEKKKIILLAGQLVPDSALTELVLRVQRNTGIAVLSESHSNLSGDGIITTIDRMLMGMSESEKDESSPELLLTFGGNIISRKVKAWLRKSGCKHWRIDEGGLPEDTFESLQGVIKMHPRDFLVDVATHFSPSEYGNNLLTIQRRIARRAEKIVPEMAFSDLTAIYRILQRLPGEWDLQMGNSSVVRYIQLFDTRSDLRYFGNRGVSGIDGVTSTAVGAASVSGRSTLLITGDIAFLYDSNAFWNGLNTDKLRIIVINNSGGGIFRIIDGPSATPSLGEYFETTHNRSAGYVAKAFDLPFRQCADEQEMAESLDWLFGEEKLAILEILTPRELNDKVLNLYFRELQQSTS